MPIDQQQAEDDLELTTPKVEAPKQEVAPAPKSAAVQIQAQREVMAIMPRTMDEAWRMAEAFHAAGMVPRSLEGKNEKETKAKVMLAICKGSEVGYAPVTAVSTIMIINNKACIYGDGATALVQNSGKVEWIKTEIQSKEDSGKWGEGYKVTVSLKGGIRNSHMSAASPSRTPSARGLPVRPAHGRIIPNANATGGQLHGLTGTVPPTHCWASPSQKKCVTTKSRQRGITWPTFQASTTPSRPQTHEQSRHSRLSRPQQAEGTRHDRSRSRKETQTADNLANHPL